MPEKINLTENIFKVNDEVALSNLNRLNRFGVFAIDIIASPGAGKTTLIERTVATLSNRLNIAVINGDLATRLDTDRAAAAGAQALQINTGGECHLDAYMLSSPLMELDLARIDLLIIENVGNLICPANFRLGSHKTVVVASVPEGADKPYKYPGTYLAASLVLLNKIDLLPYVPFDKDYFYKGIQFLNHDIDILEVSTLNGTGMQVWCNWLLIELAKFKISTLHHVYRASDTYREI
jgi:hydrogenase nickel incorporation protein HypB